MRRIASLLAVVAVSAITPSVRAGYTAVTTTDNVLTPTNGLPGPQPQIGETFNTQTSGGFASFTPDTPADPQITTDLSSYRYTLDGSVASVNLLTGVVDYTGNYRIFYDLNHDNLFDGSDPSVSSGTFNIVATFVPATNNATLAGQLNQTQGPSNPAFKDLSYGGNRVLYTGLYQGTNPGVSGTIQGALRQNALAPEPASLMVVVLSGAGLLARRRRTL